jgi:riboflavin biosynthesis pyrimidine reductase
VDVAGAVAALHERGLTRIDCEGGPALLRDVAAADQLDELCLTLSPQLRSGPAPRILTGPPLDLPVRLALTGLMVEDGDVFLRYERG